MVSEDFFFDKAGETRHGFLELLHGILKPSTYLEIGVQSGQSLALAKHSKVAIGVDPEPSISVGIPHWAKVFSETSDEFFSLTAPDVLREPIDLAFIDGMHLWEYALRDFMNIEKYSTPDTVVVFDDVLPYNQAIAARKQPPGDWTGDVWKLWYVLTIWRPDLDVTLVDVSPTGVMIVQGLDPKNTRLQNNWTLIRSGCDISLDVPAEIINRDRALKPGRAIETLKIAKEWPTS